MKRTRLLNSELSYAIARIGHTGAITLCDAGLPIPRDAWRIDLAIEPGYPTFLRTLDAMLSEMMVEEIVIASEMRERSVGLMSEMLELFGRYGMAPRVVEVPHEEFKQLMQSSEAFVRTGECTPYANVILRSGVVF